MRPSRPMTLALALAVACAPAAPPAMTDAEAVTAAAAVWDRYATALTTADVAAYLALYDPGAALDIMGQPPLVGHAALEPVARQAFATNRYTGLQIAPDWTDAVHADQIHQAGAYVETYTQGDRAMTDYGRYGTALVRGADGQWRITYLIALTDSTVSAP